MDLAGLKKAAGFVYEFNLLQLVEMGINTTNIQW